MSRAADLLLDGQAGRRSTGTRRDEQLLAAFAGGLGLADLAALFAEMYVRARGDLPDQDPGREFADREVKLATTIGGAGVIHGDLTAECAAAVAAVLDALAAPAGKERSPVQGAAVSRRAGGGDAAAGRGGAAAEAGWAAGQGVGAHLAGRPDPARRRLRAAGGMDRSGCGRGGPRAARTRPKAGASDGAWLDGDAAAAIACDAAMAAGRDRRCQRGRAGETGPAVRGTGEPRSGGGATGGGGERGLGRAGAGRDRQGRGPAVRARAGSRRSCGGGSWGCGWAGRACRWISGTPRRFRRGSATRCCCGTGTASGPAAAPQPPAPARCTHHDKAHGGKTSVKDCALLCPFHHQVVIHRWGWTLVVNPDGTTSAWNKNKTKVLRKATGHPPAPGKDPACPGPSTTPSTGSGDPGRATPVTALCGEQERALIKQPHVDPQPGCARRTVVRRPDRPERRVRRAPPGRDHRGPRSAGNGQRGHEPAGRPGQAPGHPAADARVEGALLTIPALRTFLAPGWPPTA